MKEKGSFVGLETFRNAAAAAVLIPTSSFFQLDNPTTANYAQLPIANVNNTLILEEPPIHLTGGDFQANKIEQLDDFIKSNFGKALTAGLLAYAFFSYCKAWQESYDRDKRRKFIEAATSSTLFLGISVILLRESYTDVNIDERVISVSFMAYALSQAAYIVEDTLERDRLRIKNGIGLLKATSLLSIATATLVESFK